MKLAIVGSRAFKNEDRIKWLLEKYIYFYGGPNLEIISGGCSSGADTIAKSLALNMTLTYKEFPPKHRPYNEYCICAPENYAQPYHVSNFFARNSQIAEYCDHAAVFIVKNLECNGSMDTFRKANNLKKRTFLIY